MKILKKQIHGFLANPFELEGRQWLSASVMLYFDLAEPGNLHKEQDLWQEVPPLLGEVPLIDQGWPKPRGEFLVAGSCHAPRGSKVTGSRVNVTVGGVSKELAVFGPRRWERSLTGLSSISAPESFSSMPVSWEHAYGGEGYPENPSGKGCVEVAGEDGKPYLPLPEIENPAALITSRGEQPVPSGFSLVPAHLPRRAKLSGTYDKQWQRERWPGFPEDLDPEFFQAAPPGQQLEGFFTGEERIRIRNMHPDMPFIDSSLPQRRIRLFFLRRPDAAKRSYFRKDLLDGEFIEAKLNAETLWLFPDILRGILLFRAVTPCIDDEYSDIAWAHVADEEPGSEPLSLEHYRDYVLEHADFGQSVIDQKMQELQKKLGKGAQKVLNLPKTFKEVKSGIEGNAPVMQTDRGILEDSLRKGFQEQRILLDKLEAALQKLHGQFGHMVSANFGAIGNARNTLAGFERSLDEASKAFAGAEKENEKVLGEAGKRLGKLYSPEQLQDMGIDPENLAESQKTSPFHDRWFPQVVRSRMMLHADRTAMGYLREEGLGHDVIRRNWLGWNTLRQVFPPDGDLPEELVLPEGLVIPRFEGTLLTGLLVRPLPITDAAQEVVVPGSDQTPRFLEPASEGGPVVVLPDALSGFLLEEDAGDFAGVAIAENAGTGLPDEAKELVEGGVPLVVVLPGSGLDTIRDQWLEAFPEVLFLQPGQERDVFEARRKGMDIREELLRLLPSDMTAKHRLVVQDIAGDLPGVPVDNVLSQESIGAAIEKGFKEIQAATDAKIAPLLKQVEGTVEGIRNTAASMGTNVPDIKPSDASTVDIADLMSKQADILDAERKKLLDRGFLPPDKASLMEEASARLRKEGPVWQQQKEQLDTMEPTGEMKKAFGRHGMDVDNLKPVTEGNLQERLAAGNSFRMVSFKKLDLSGIDFSGKDLTMARFESCAMTGCRFDGTEMTSTVFRKCDLTQADFTGAKMERTVFKNSRLTTVVFRDTPLRQVMFDGCDLSGADFLQSSLMLCSCRKTVFKDADFTNARIELASMDKADLNGACMDGISLKKCMLKQCKLDGQRFRGIETDALLLHGCSGGDVRFERSKLFKFRIGNECSLPGLKVEECRVEQGYFRDANLSGASFLKSSLRHSIFDGCDLTRSDFRGVGLFGCQFPKSDLERADLSHCNLFMGSLRKARLVNANLSGSNLFGVDFRKCVMRDTEMGDANLRRSLFDGREEELKQGRYTR